MQFPSEVEQLFRHYDGNEEWVRTMNTGMTHGDSAAASFEQPCRELSERFHDLLVQPLIECLDDAVTEFSTNHPIQRLCPETLADAHRCRLAWVPTRFFNAEIMLAQDGTNVVLLNQSVPNTLSFYIESMWDSKALQAGGARYQAEIENRVIRYFSDSQKSEILTLQRTLDATEYATSLLLTLAAELFIAAHELAHVCLGHVDESILIQCQQGNQTLDFYRKSMRDEFFADKLGYCWFKIAVSRHKELSKLPKSLLLSAPLYSFAVGLIIEKNASGIVGISTHPSYKSRASALIDSSIQSGTEEHAAALTLVQMMSSASKMDQPDDGDVEPDDHIEIDNTNQLLRELSSSEEFRRLKITEVTDESIEAAIYHLGELAGRESDQGQALKIHSQIERLCRTQTGFAESLAVSLVAQGQLLCHAEKFNAAIEKLEEADEICQANTFVTHLIDCHKILSECFFYSNNPGGAAKSLKTIVHHLSSQGNSPTLRVAMGRLGSLLMNVQGKELEAMEMFSSLIERCGDEGVDPELARGARMGIDRIKAKIDL